MNFVLPPYGETSTCRARLAPFCVGNGLDIGFGGTPITKNAICLDRPENHGGRAKFEDEPWPTHLVGDAANLWWFNDNVLDFVFSSHVLEDFDDTGAVLREWWRVIRPGGRLVLFLPDQPTYVAYCLINGQLPNQAHKHENFGLDFIKARLPEQCKIIHEKFPVEGNPYSFDLVLEKHILC